MIRNISSIILFAAFAGAAFAQPEVMAWGNLTGVRVDGHLLELSTSMCIAQPELAGVSCTGREKQQNSYSRNGKVETITVQMRAPREFRDPQGAGWTMAATEIVEDAGPATAKIAVEFTSPGEANIGGAFLGIELPASIFSGGSVELIAPDPPTAERRSLAAGTAEQNEYLRATATGARFVSRTRQIEVTFDQPTQIIIRDDRRKGSYNLQVLLAVLTGNTTEGQTGKKSFTFKVTGEIDKKPVEISLDASHPGQLFDGLGGNFRLQNARTDPQVIDYSLENIRVGWGRVEMPWSIWQPDENTDPLAAARAGNVNPRVLQAMEIARRLAQKGIPVIVSAWQAPGWAVLGSTGGGGGGRGGGGRGLNAGGAALAGAVPAGAAPAGVAPGAATPSFASPGGAAPGAPIPPGAGRDGAAPGAAPAGAPSRSATVPGIAPGIAPGTAPGTAPAGAPSGAPGRGGVMFAQPQQAGPRGNPLNPEKMSRIKESIAGYLIFLKEKYGVEAAMFSFNESDLGINVRQTPREHAELIKTLGPYFAAKGLATKLALGDTSDANPIDFIKPAMKDPEAIKYIGAVDFHSWRGCTDEILAQWRDAARELNVPLVIAEGSTDAAAYRYPQIFNEQSFALYEINLYLRILAIAQPRSILQWQFTADYSVLAGGGIFNDNGPLRPTRRFWNLKQLAATPPRSFSLPVACDKQPNLTCAAFGNIAEGIYTVHMVNHGATRTATLTGIPPNVKQLRLWVTDAQRGMQECDRIPVTDGKAQFSLAATSYTTVIGGNQ